MAQAIVIISRVATSNLNPRDHVVVSLSKILNLQLLLKLLVISSSNEETMYIVVGASMSLHHFMNVSLKKMTSE